jgi:hypothetical protein
VEALQAALTLRRTLDDRSGIASTLVGLGHVVCKQGRYAQARVYLVEALETASANQATPLLLRALTGAAALLTGVGEPVHAIELLACVLHHPGTESRARAWARRGWADAARLLPEPDVAAAQTRGRQLELLALAAGLPSELAGLGDD